MDIDTVFQMAEYVMLALGLNIVVGYAGLLDLGYVAFFALGAYTLGWFGSASSPTGHPLPRHESRSPCPAFHMSFWVVMILAGVVAGTRRAHHRLADPALREDYLAIVTARLWRDHPRHLPGTAIRCRCPRASRSLPFVEFGAHNLTNGSGGHAARSPWVRPDAERCDGRAATATARSRPS